MTKYDDLSGALKDRLEAVCEADPYGLNPKNFYKNIYHSSGSDEQLARIFEIVPSLVREVKES